MKKIKNKLQNKKVLLFFILLLSIPLLSTFARYVAMVINNYYLEAKHFYFNSDKLSENHPTYQINNWTGLDSIDFVINLDSKKNELQLADMDITYEIEFNCEEDVICSLSKNEGTIYSATNTDSFTVTMTPTRIFDEGESTTINIIAKSTSPYEKQIGARFIVSVGKQGVTYEITDEVGSPYLMLNITNALTQYTVNEAFDSYEVNQKISEKVYKELSVENKAKCTSALIQLEFNPNIVLLDTTNTILKSVINQTTATIDNAEYLNGISFKIDSSSSVAIRFYKKDKSQNYTYPGGNSDSTIIFNVS